MNKVLQKSILLALLFAACSSGDRYEEIRLTELDAWGGMKAQEQAKLGYPSDFIISSKGEVVVTDVRLNQVLYFTQTGQLIRRAGKPGSGPLEFAIPDDIAQVGNELAIWDYQNNRLQFLTLDGEFIRFSVPEPRIDFNSKTLDSKGQLYYATNGFRADSLIYVYSPEGEFVKTFGQIAGSKFSDYEITHLRESAKKRHIPDAVKNAVLICATTNNDIFVVHTALPRLAKYRQDGKKIFEIELSDQRFAKETETFFAVNDTLPDFSFKPLRFWADIVADSKGGVLLLHNNPKQLIVSHFNEDGKLVKKYLGPAINISKIYLHNEELWAVGRQDLTFYRFSTQPQENIAANR